jgi:hypothetical protein
LWLLKDIPALAVMLATLWLATITTLRAATRKQRGHQPSQATLKRIFSLFAATEAAHDWAIMRQASRLLGLSARAVPFPNYAPPTSLAVYDHRFTAWLMRSNNLDAAAREEAEILRRSLNITRAEAQAPVAIGVCVARRPLSSSGALRRGRWHARPRAHDGGGSHDSTLKARARAPPLNVFRLYEIHLAAPPARTRPHALS